MGQQKKVIIGEVPEGEKVLTQEVKKEVKQEIQKGRPSPKPSSEPRQKPQRTDKKVKQGRAKKRSQRFLRLRAKVDRARIYSIEEAIKLIQGLAGAKFKESLELHLKISGQKDKKDYHMKIGQAADKAEDLLKKISQALDQFPKTKIEKAVLCSTMGPGVKIDLTKL